MPDYHEDFAEDTRKVQTGVLGGAEGHVPVFLPYDEAPANALRDLHGKNAFYCGALLGGCGSVLTLRASAEKKSHFAHRPPVACRRTAQGEDSADHLYIGEALKEWLRSRGTTPHEVEYLRQQNGPWDALRIRFGGTHRHRTIHVQMTQVSYKEWETFAARDTAQANVLRTYGPDSGLPAYECGLSGYALRFKCETRDSTRVVLVGTQFATDAAGEHYRVEWATLRECRLTEAGILTPALRESSGGLLVKSASKDSVSEVTISSGKEPAVPGADSTRPHGMTKAIGEARRARSHFLGDGWTVPYPRIRSALRAIGRRYSSANERGRTSEAFAAVRLFADHTDTQRELPEWLRKELVQELESRRRETQRSSATGFRENPNQPGPEVTEPSTGARAAVSPAPLRNDASAEQDLEVLNVDRPPLTDPGATFDVLELSPRCKAPWHRSAWTWWRTLFARAGSA